MHMTVLFASPRGAHSNTRALLVPFLETWRAAGHTAEVFSLFDLHIEPCRACRGCQMDWEHPACVLADDMPAIFDAVLRSDILLLAAPIHSWFCPPAATGRRRAQTCSSRGCAAGAGTPICAM